MSVFVYADPHFGHHNIMAYCRRPWVSVDKMDGDLVKLYNEKVGKDGVVYWLGDVTLHSAEKVSWLRRILGKMNGRKILVYGNHDRWHWERYLDAGFESCHTTLQIPPIQPGKPSVQLCHDPAWAQDNSRLWVCGHLHNNAFVAPYHIAIVSVELTNYAPVELSAIMEGHRPGVGVLRVPDREDRR